MPYQQTVNEIRAAANAVNPNGRFDHGKHVDFSQKYEGAYPFICLYPIDFNKGIDPNFIDEHRIVMSFFNQDKPESTTLEREQIIAEMDALSDRFLDYFNEIKGIRITNVQKESAYNWYSANISGIHVLFNYQNFAPCDPNDPS